MARGHGAAVAGNLAAHPHMAEGVLQRALEGLGNLGDRILADIRLALDDLAGFGIVVPDGGHSEIRTLIPRHQMREGAGKQGSGLKGYTMNILLIGSGGREHALAWAIARSPLCDRLFVSPGNPASTRSRG